MYPVKVRLSEAYLTELASRNDSYVYRKELNHHIILDPSGLSDVKSAIRKTLDAGINKYDKKIGGLFLGYSNIKLLQNRGLVFYDDSFIHLDITADFYVFTPELGCTLTGIVTKISENHVGCLVHKVFNASVINTTEEKEDWPGGSIQTGQEVQFRVTVLDMTGPLPYIRGKFSEVPMAKEMQLKGDKAKKSRKKKLKLEVCVEDYSIELKKKRKKVVSEISEVQDGELLGDVNEVPVSNDFASHVTPASLPPSKKKRKRSDESTDDLEHPHRQKKKNKEDPKRSESTHEIQSDVGTSHHGKGITNSEAAGNFIGTSPKKHKKKLSLGIPPQNHAANSGSREKNVITGGNEEGVEHQDTINILTASTLYGDTKKKKKKREKLEPDVPNVFHNPDAENRRPVKTSNSDVSTAPSASLPVKEKNKKTRAEPELDCVKENKMSEVSTTKKKKQKKLTDERILKLLPGAESNADTKDSVPSSPSKSYGNDKEINGKKLNKYKDVMLPFPDNSTSALKLENINPKNVASKRHNKEEKIVDEPQNEFIKENEEFQFSPMKKKKNRKRTRESISESSKATLMSLARSDEHHKDDEEKFTKHKDPNVAFAYSHTSALATDNIKFKSVSIKNSKHNKVKTAEHFEEKTVNEPESDFAKESEESQVSATKKKKNKKSRQQKVAEADAATLISHTKSNDNNKDNEEKLNKHIYSELALSDNHTNSPMMEKINSEHVSSKNIKHNEIRNSGSFGEEIGNKLESGFVKESEELELSPARKKKKKEKKPVQVSVPEVDSASLFSPTDDYESNKVDDDDDDEEKFNKFKDTNLTFTDGRTSAFTMENIKRKNVSAKNNGHNKVKKDEHFEGNITDEQESDFVKGSEEIKLSQTKKKKNKISRHQSVSESSAVPLVPHIRSYESNKDNEEIVSKLKDSVLAFAESHRNSLSMEKIIPKIISSKNSKSNHNTVKRAESFEEEIREKRESGFVMESKESQLSPTKKKKNKKQAQESVSKTSSASLFSPSKSGQINRDIEEKLHKHKHTDQAFSDSHKNSLTTENVELKNISPKNSKHVDVKTTENFEQKIVGGPHSDFAKENEDFKWSDVERKKINKPVQESVTGASAASLASLAKSYEGIKDNEDILNKLKDSVLAFADNQRNILAAEKIVPKNVSSKNSKHNKVKKTEEFNLSPTKNEKNKEPAEERVFEASSNPLISPTKFSQSNKNEKEELNNLFKDSHRKALTLENMKPKNVQSKKSKYNEVKKGANVEQKILDEPGNDFVKEVNVPPLLLTKKKSRKTAEESVSNENSDLHTKTLETLLARARSMINEPAELLSNDNVMGRRKIAVSSKPAQINNKNVTTSEDAVPTPARFTSEREKIGKATPSTHGKSEETGKTVGNDSIAQLLAIAQRKLSNIKRAVADISPLTDVDSTSRSGFKEFEKTVSDPTTHSKHRATSKSDEGVLGKISPKKRATSSRSRSQRLSLSASQQKTSSPRKLHFDSVGSVDSKQLEHAVPVPSQKAPTSFDTCSLQLSPEPLQRLIDADDDESDEGNLAAIYKTPEYFRSDGMANAEDRRSSKSNRRSLLSLNKPTAPLATTAHLHEENKNVEISGGDGPVRRGHGIEGLSGFLTSDDDSHESVNLASSQVSVAKSADGLKDITLKLLGRIPNLARNLPQNKEKENQINTESTGMKGEVPGVGISKLHPSVKLSRDVSESGTRSSELEVIKSENLGKHGIKAKVKRKKEDTKEHNKRHKNKSKNLCDSLDEGDVDKMREHHLKSYLSRLTLE